MRKRGNRKKFYEWLTNRYELIIRNEADFAEKRSLTFTYAKLLSILFVFFAFTMGVSLFLGKYLLSEWFDPEHEYRGLKYEVVSYSEQLDSLERQLEIRGELLYSFRKYLDPEYSEDVAKSTPAASELIELEEDEEFFPWENFNPYQSSNRNSSAPLAIYYSPVDHLKIHKSFSIKEKRYGLEYQIVGCQGIRAIADGEVILARWEPGKGHVIVLQHAGGLLSVYRNNDVILKKVNNFVVAGEIMAMSGNVQKATTKSLIIELWKNNYPIDPETVLTK